MANIAIVVDSTAALDSDYIERHKISVVPLYVKMDDDTFKDGVDISAQEFYARLPSCRTLPTTSQPSAGDFQTVYAQLVEDGAEGIISVHLSSGLSGTVNSALLAKEQMPDVPIEVVDTRSVSAGHQLVIEGGINSLAAGANMEQAVAGMKALVEAHRIVFTVETLEYLYKGGRIGGAAALVGSLLQFKPLLAIQEGRVEALERVRTRKRALARMVAVMGEWMGDQEVEALVMEAECPDVGAAVQEHLPRELNVKRARVCHLTPVIGTHGGPGTIGVCCVPSALYGEFV
jgi:DegV family protein with EDD domain